MMMQLEETRAIDPNAEQNAFLAAIGHICLQWALLEQTVLFIIGVAENLPIQKVYPRYGGLDMLKRIGMAITVSREAKWPKGLTQRLIEIRKTLQKGGDAIADERNLFVHGVHKMTSVPGEFELTMSRWSADKRSRIVTKFDAIALAYTIAEMAEKADGIFCDYGLWKFGVEPEQYGRLRMPQTKATLRFLRAQQRKRAVKLLLDNWKPW